MGQGFGIESHPVHASGAHRERTRYLVVIDAAGETVARLFTKERVEVADFDASTEEVAVMTNGLVATHGANEADWGAALAGHTANERAAALVYTLDV